MNEYKLKDLIKIHNGKDHKCLSDGSIPVYGSSGIMRYVDDFIYDGEVLLLPRKGTLDNIQYVNGKFWCVDTTYWATPITNQVNMQYLYCYLSLLDLSARDSGSTLPSMTFDSYYSLPIKLPDIKVQNEYANLIFDVLEKIEFNNKTINVIESLAKTIYDYWFLQFEFPNENGKPYKSSGGKMVWNEELKREIPEGWKNGNLYDIADFVNGLACQKYRPTSENEDKLRVIKITEMHDGFTENTEFVSSDVPTKYIINDGDILFSWSASLEVMLWNNGKGCLNQHIFKVNPKNYGAHYVYMQLASYVINFIKLAEARKTTMGHITTDHLKQSKICLPDFKVVNLYEQKMLPLFTQITNLKQENQKLTSLRDFLLPMLMNGQVTFKEKA